ncbi:MAG: molecular chaperone DnaJ [Caulobacteraceae bacterium]|nr:MAG: molecular chaperone DnaJ [Caulobacteraceae bacterium]
MIYLLLAAAVVGLLVWTGRRALPKLAKSDWRVATAVLGALAVVGGVAAAMRGSLLLGGGLVLVGLGLAFGARTRRPARPDLPAPGDSEARAILGVTETADEAEIQAAYSRLIRMAHPDKGGTAGLAAQLNAARDRLLRR